MLRFIWLVLQGHLAVCAGAALPVEVDHAGRFVVTANLGRPSFHPAAGVLQTTFVLQYRMGITIVTGYKRIREVSFGTHDSSWHEPEAPLVLRLTAARTSSRPTHKIKKFGFA